MLMSKSNGEINCNNTTNNNNNDTQQLLETNESVTAITTVTSIDEDSSNLISKTSGEPPVLTTPPSSKSTSPLQNQQQQQQQQHLQQQQQQHKHFHNQHHHHQQQQQQQQFYSNNLNLINQQLLLNNLKQQQQQQHTIGMANTNQNPNQNNTNNETAYYQTFNGHFTSAKPTTIDVNSLNHSYQQQQQQHQQQQQQQQGFIQQIQSNQAAVAAATLNAYSLMSNPYLNLLNTTSQQQQQQSQAHQSTTSPIAVTNASVNNTGLIANCYAQTAAAAQPSAQFSLTAIASNGNVNGNQIINLNDEHQVYEYLHQLLDEKEKLKELFNEPLNILLPISARLLDEEISRIRVNLFQLGGKESVCLPEPIGSPLQMTEKLYVPVKDHPEFNFVGRILGPRGMTAKQLEQETGCKIMVRGKGSMRDKAKEEQMKGKPNWEHLNDELHVLITVEDTKNRAEVKLKRAVEEIKRLLVPAPEGEDELKKKQLMELAIINGTYRDGSKIQQKMNQILIPQNGSAAAASLAQAVASAVAANNGQLRSPPNPLGGQPLIISPRLAAAAAAANSNTAQQILAANGAGPQSHHQLIAQSTDPNTGGLIYTTIPASALYSDHHAAAAAALNANLNAAGVLDYPNGIEFSQAGSIKTQRFSTVNSATMRAHPYARVALS